MTKYFVFRSNQSIGAAQAELDGHFLQECFVDTGDLAILCDCDDPRRIVAGRTGSGKSALISRLILQEENTIDIRPESLSLTYIANSGVLNFFTEAGVKMDIFYRLLWRHVLVVEILKARFKIDNEASKKSFLEQLWQIIPRKKQHELALQYLRKWGESFWQETEYRVKEVTSTLEKELEGSLGGAMKGIASLTAATARRLTEEQKEEVVNRAQEVVNRVQIAELSRVIDLMGEVLLEDPQRRFFVVIDKLDEDWVEDRLRFRLIRALIETSLDFAKIKNVKVILSARNDLLDRVYRYTRDAGFQEEKYKTATLQLAWTRDELIKLLDNRIKVLVKDQYTKHIVTTKDLLPRTIGKEQTIDYMIARTLLRPRDLIQFFNACIRQSDGKATISVKALREAEGIYSRERLRALADEWFGVYPNLMHLANVLKKCLPLFQIKDLPLDKLEENYLELLISGRGGDGMDLHFMEMRFDGGMSMEEYRKNLTLIFYKVGLIGLKTDAFLPMSWSDAGGVSVSSAELNDNSKVSIHKAFWRCLGISSKSDYDNEGIEEPLS